MTFYATGPFTNFIPNTPALGYTVYPELLPFSREWAKTGVYNKNYTQ